MTRTPPPAEHGETPLIGCFTRVAWILVLPAAVFYSALLIAERKAVAGISPHLVLAAMVALAIAVRWADVVLFKGQTANGEPATLGEWRRYALVVAAAGAVLWLLGTMVARLGLLL